MNSDYAYSVDQSAREHLVPNLIIVASQPFMGLTAYIGDEPHLIIGKEGSDTFLMEDEYGQVKKIDYIFPWEEPKFESNKLVAASRIEESPFREVGLLAYVPETGEWAVRMGSTTEAYPLFDKIASLEDQGWSKFADGDSSGSSGLDLGGMGVSGPATHEHPGAGHNEPTIEVRAACPHCHSDQHLELASDESHPHSDEKKYVCHNCGKWSHEHELEVSDHDKDGQDQNPEGVDYSEHDDDASRHQEPEEEKEVHNDKHEEDDFFESDRKKKHSSSSSFHAQGYPAAGAEVVQGIAINLDKTSEAEAEGIIGKLPSPIDAERSYVGDKNTEHGTSFPMFDSPFVNRGGSIREAEMKVMPSPVGIPEPGSFKFANSFILIKRFFNPDDVGLVAKPSCKGVLSSEGGTTSHIQVVARGMGKVSLITHAETINQINTGDQVVLDPHTGEISVNGARGSYSRPEKFTDIIADEPIYRFVWANGHGYSEKMTNEMVGDKGGHFGMMDMLAKEGRWSYEDLHNTGMPNGLAYGFFCSNGVIIQDLNTQHIDEEHFLQWAHQEETNLGLPPGHIKFRDISQNMGGGAPAAEPQMQQEPEPDQQQQQPLGKVAAVFEMPYPGGQGIHNGTSAAFSNAGIHATVTAPGAPSPITLPFSAPNMFIMAKMFQSQGFFVPGQPIQIDSDNPELARQIIQQQSGIAGKISYSEQKPEDGPIGDKLEDALVCTHCGSHTISTLAMDEMNDQAEFLCHTCGSTFKAKYRKSAAAKHPKGTRVEMTHPSKKGVKGSITDEAGQDENFGDSLYNLILDNGDELNKVPEIHFKKIKSASVKESDMAPQMTPAAQPAQNSGTGMQTPLCPHCGSQTQGTPSFYTCPTCGWSSMQGTNQAQTPPGTNNTYHSSIKSSSLSVGEWYTMYSPEYKVPDVVQIVDVNEHDVTANIEGDDKGLFPITLPHKDIEIAGYKFEPYSNPSEVKTAKVARRSFTIKEQQDLINENLEGRARNFHKLNLEGTHYPSDVEASVDPLNDPFYLW